MTVDHVTRLAPRAELQALLDDLSTADAAFAVVLCDVVGLKRINDSQGFAAGDVALAAAADRLRESVTGAALLARLGGDEFMVVFVGAEAARHAATTAERLSADGAPPFRSAASAARPGETPTALIDRLYATLRRS